MEREDCITQARNGDRNALAELLKAHSRRINDFVRNRVDDPSDVEDLVQDVFIQIQKSIDSYRGQSSLSTWVLGIALNLVRNYYNRSPQYRFQFVAESAADQTLVTSDSVEREVAVDELVDRLQQAFDQLAPDARDLLSLVVVQDLSYEQAAQRLGISISSVKSRLFRARRALRALL